MAALMHVIGTRWHDGRAALLVDQDGLQEIPLDGAFDWQVQERTCTGYWHEGWHPCPDRTPVGHDNQCLLCFRGRGDHDRRDDQPDCIFEPRCKSDPSHCICSFGAVPHVVYCAFYGGLPKVGMTMERRAATRLREQGADAYFIIQHYPDRATARAAERQIAFLYGLPEWRRHDEVFPQLTRPVDRERVMAAARQWQTDLRERYDIGDVCWVPHGLAPLPSRPHRVEVEGHHEGEWLGAKGAHFFYQAPPGPLGSGPVLALKRHDLLGHWIAQ